MVKQTDWVKRTKETEEIADRIEKNLKDFEERNKKIFSMEWFTLNYPPQFVIEFTFHGLNKVTENCLVKIQPITTFVGLQGLRKSKRIFQENKITYRFWLPF